MTAPVPATTAATVAPESRQDARTATWPDAAYTTGAALYTHDLALGDARALHAWPVQSPHAHARVVELDTAGARTESGVATVLTAHDVAGENDVGVARRDEPLFPSEVQYHGQPVAWVIADTEAHARSAARRVRVEYEPLPAMVTLDDAVAAGAWLTPERVIACGDVETALAASQYRLEGDLHVGGQEHFYLETQAAYATVDESGDLLVHSSTQHPTETQAIVARVVGRPANRVVCQSLRMGGAFGGKEIQANGIAAVAALGTLVTGRPVSVRLDRRRDMTITGKRHAFLGRYRVGFEPDGRLNALDVSLVSDGGWSLDLSEAILWRALFHIDNAYHVPHLRVRGRVARTNLPSSTAMRGFGGPQAMVIVEEVVDRVARTLALGPEAVRARNFYQPGDRTHYGQEVRHAERIARVFAEARADSGFDARRDEIARWNDAHPHTKRGLAITPVKFGISFTTAFFNQAGAFVLVYRDGSVQVNHGGTEMGQGLHAKVRAIAATTLGVDAASVRMMPTRTDKIPNTSATAASSGADLNGAAVLEACETLRERLRPFAARLLGVDPSELEFAGGHARRKGSERGASSSVPLARVIEQAYLARVPLFATGYYRTPGLAFDPERGQGEPFHYFAFGAAVSEVEVDGFTGQYTLRRVDIVHDVGDSLHPTVDRGQIEGGFLQGVGWLTCEELRVGEDGALLTRGASTYKLPGIGECPAVFNVRTLTSATEPGVVQGSKAVGEPPLMLAISVREALRDAVAAFRGTPGPVTLASPATPEAVYWAISG
ncbi:MAG: xanthine dehydrogenase molybdopterin binding subunit, partial [Vicinamibacteraceae bacterium]|nr:xanthine dehydrogenase molybdopterin binding subunit [Vicinamibacteraceae bacterium]